MRKLSLIFIFISSLTPTVALADIPALMNKLVALRADLETANREMESELKILQADLELWTTKRLELEGQMQKESLRKLQLDEKVQRLANRVKIESKVNPQAKVELKRWLTEAEAWVESSLPFRKSARLEVIQNLRERADRGLESPEILSAELWQFYESDMKLASDNEYRITDFADIGKAEVARLGLYTLFAKSADGAVRQAVFENGQWAMRDLSDDNKANAERLLNNMKGKRDSGLYNLPPAQSAQKDRETL